MGRFYLIILIGLTLSGILAGWVFSASRNPWVSGVAAMCFFAALATLIIRDFLSVSAGFDRLLDEQAERDSPPDKQVIFPPKPEARQFWRDSPRRSGLARAFSLAGGLLFLIALGLEIQATLMD